MTRREEKKRDRSETENPGIHLHERVSGDDLRRQVVVVLVALCVFLLVAMGVIVFEIVYDDWHWSDRLHRKSAQSTSTGLKPEARK